MQRLQFLLVFLVFFIPGRVLPQISDPDIALTDTASIAEPIFFTPASASDYLHGLIDLDKLWRSDNDTLKRSLARLLQHYGEPFDSVRKRLLHFPFDSIPLKPGMIIQSDTLPLRWLDRNVFIVDTIALKQSPVYSHKTIIVRKPEIDSINFIFSDSIPDVKIMLDSILRVMVETKDTIIETRIDYSYLETKKVQVYRIEDGAILPSLLPRGSGKSVRFLADSTGIVVSYYSQAIMAGNESPFYILPGKKTPDSLRLAVETLLEYTYLRDSVLLHLHDIQGKKTLFWLSTGKPDMYRYWVKNTNQDSITIWIGNPAKNQLSLLLEEDVSVERLEPVHADDIPITVAQPLRVLAPLRPLKEIPVLWNYSLTSSFSLNQNYLSNWARGGQSSLSGMVDIRSEAKYTNNESKVTWTNTGRLRYGSIRTKEQGYRTSTDIFELGSQYNKRINKSLDFSAVFYGMTQVARGFKYPNDSVVVSKFLNPGTFTIGAGLEYKPFKETLINFSVLSYKNTFVLDTARIDQTVHGILAGKRARQEMGGQLVIRNKTAIMDGLNVTNSIRLFSNYIEKPQNVDVDWEMNIEKQINWLFTIRLNVHLIYDDDIRFPVLDKEGNPVLLPDGTAKRVAKPQFNQFFGLSLSFRI